MDSLTITTILLLLGFIVTLIGIIYTNLNGKVSDNSSYIKAVNDEMKKEYITKTDHSSFKSDHAIEHSRINADFDKLDKKLDKIIQMLLEGKHEK